MTSTRHTPNRRKQLVATVLTWSVLWQALTPAYAIPSQLPGIYIAPPDPNVMFTLDNSGSMASDGIPDFVSDVAGMPNTADSNAENENLAKSPGMWKSGTRYLDASFYRSNSSVNGAIARYLRSAAGNPLYYDPKVTYVPWPTAANNLVTFPNADPARVLIDPSIPANARGGTIDLTQWRGSGANRYWPATYYVYNGTTPMPPARPHNALNVEGSFTKYEIISATATPTFPRPPSATDPLVSSRTDCSGAIGPTGCTYQQELQNFANWLQYYRSRMLTAKGGVSAAFAQQGSRLRVGYTIINGGVRQGVASFTGGSRQTFFNNLFTENTGGGTPLRQAMHSVGQYFQGTTSHGNPWAETTSGRPDPISDSCRKSFHILTTDGFWNDSAPPAPASNNNDTFGTSGAPERTPPQDGVATVAPTFPYTDNGDQSTLAGRFTINPFRDNNPGAAQTLADVAAYYWKTDLQIGLENRLSPSTRDPAFWQHLTTFTVGLGVTGTGNVRPVDASLSTVNAAGQQVVAASATAFRDFVGQPWLADPQLRDLLVTRRTPLLWTAPTGNSAATGDDLIHAAMNARGRYFSATSPTQLAAGLSSALAEATDQPSSLTTVGLNNTITTGANRLYQAVYNPYGWSGRVYAFDVPATGNVNTTPSSAVWEASRMMPAPTSRSIYTWNPSLAVPAAAPFTQAGLNTTQWNTLGASNTERLNVLNYLRGDGTYEEQNSGTLRNRVRDQRSPGVTGGVLGDIVGGSPVKGPDYGGGYNRMRVGSPGADTYAAFRNAEIGSSRIRTMRQSLFFGANDGMLHTVNTEDGVERFAFVPNSVFSVPRTRYEGVTATVNKLYRLSRPDYSHLFTVNGPPQIGDAYIGATPAAASWKTVLVSSTGAGARSVFAMDVTNTEVGSNPENFGPGKILWERSEANGGDFADMGHMPSYPHIAKMRDGRWVAMFGNGYDSSTGRAKLYIVDLQTGGIIWQPVVGPTTANGLSQPNFLMNEFREVVGIWAGDLRGNMWKFDVSSADPTLWRVAYNGDPLFTTTANQPITVMPQLSRFQTTSQVMVTFGTGKLFDLEDTSTSAATNVNLTQQAIYGLWDDGATPIAGIARLVEQTAGARGTGSFSTTSRNTVNFSPTVRGWYMRLDDGTGERVHVNPIIPFNSPNTPVYIVANTPSTAPCSSGGSTRLFALDPQTGQAPSFTVFTGGTGGNVYSSTSGVGSTPSFAGGATPPDMTRNTNVLGGNGQIGGTTFEEGDCISGSEAQSPNSSTGIESLEIGGPVCRGRISWRQLK